MKNRNVLLFYITRLSDERIHHLTSCASVSYAEQKADELITLNEKDLCAEALARLDERFAHYVYMFAQSGLKGSMNDVEQLRQSIHILAEQVKSPSVLHRVYMILTRAFNNWE